MPPRTRFWSVALCAGLIGLSPGATGPAHATAAPELRQAAKQWLHQQVMQNHPDTEARIEIGPLDARLRLAACPQVRFSLPSGARLWRNGSLSARCEAPSRWQVYLSYRIELSGPALVSQRALPARHPIVAADVALARVRYQHEPGAYPLTLPAGAVTVRATPAGQPILIRDLALPNVIQAGATVRIRVRGAGFSVTQEGVALNPAQAGGEVRVRTPSGRIVHGHATAAGEVEIRP